MAKFHGVIGYGTSVEVANGVWEDSIIEKTYFGDVIKNTRRLGDSDSVGGVNSDIAVNNIISIVADAYANAHFFAIRYIRWAGTLWTVSEIEVQSPRLLLRLGGVYNGPTA